ncbi:hypothetical protein MKZ02_20160 [Pseudobacillus sp. FSL P4-0506]|uniref:hypothetical protein n=1 Tax=Pseudobacillus sp. FSL P4-0506 TaxID=2921576 RepID=UPI0030F75CC7
MKFLIQTRKENSLRGFDAIINSAGNAKDWNNYTHSFDDLKKAQSECESLIKGGIHKAENIRIVEVVCTFEANVTVKSKSDKY